jgi:hypothetical protein
LDVVLVSPSASSLSEEEGEDSGSTACVAGGRDSDRVSRTVVGHGIERADENHYTRKHIRFIPN